MDDWFDELQQQLWVAFDRAVADFEQQVEQQYDAAIDSADRWLVETTDEVESAVNETIDRAPPEVRRMVADAEQWLEEWGEAIDRSLDRLDEILDDALFDRDEDLWGDREGDDDGANPSRSRYDPSDDPDWFVPLTHIRPTAKQHPACRGCENYHGYRYGENLFICAMHPYGWEGDDCPDWEGDRESRS